MQPIGTFRVVPAIPPPLEALRELAYNLWWTWNHPAVELFRRLDDQLWERSGHNPVALLGAVAQQQLDEAAADPGYVASVERVASDLHAYMADRSTWFSRTHGQLDRPLVAYFSAEFGLTECLSIFAGGLGLLAGDHLKAASDLGLPLVGVGLLYQEGYFRQYLNEAGWQQEAYVDNDFLNLPLVLERASDGSAVSIELPFPERNVRARVWRAQVGRVPLYLLDTNVESNAQVDRGITKQLYGGDLEMRLQQEILLGVGGHQALRALGLYPPVYHLNEGHSAFLALAHMRQLTEGRGLSFGAVRELTSAGLIFTSHTPVAAGHDYFPADLLDRYLAGYPKAIGLSRRRALGLGRINSDDANEPFGMTTLALRLAAHTNGVSRLHAQVTRRMFQSMWPRVPEDEIPITHVTNAVHLRSWVSREMDRLYDRYLGQNWWQELTHVDNWQRAIAGIPPEELWRTHELRRERLVVFARRRLRRQLEQRGRSPADQEQADHVLNLDALTIGFARRFATYKRATLLLTDIERLAKLVNDPHRPVQILFAGKAHPRDEPGKSLIQQIARLGHEERFRHRIVFLEDYDLAIARELVQGCDVWLNTPQRPLEASGTSGMKAAVNGVLNVSTLDGWWDEAWHDLNQPASPIGWSIGRGETYGSPDEQDRLEADALYELLERDVIPTFYSRNADDMPQAWIAMMKASMSKLVPSFAAQRMVRDYTERCYLPAATQVKRLSSNEYALAKELADWRQRVERTWSGIAIRSVEVRSPNELRVGEPLDVRARVELRDLTADDVNVDVYFGRIDANNQFIQARSAAMQLVTTEDHSSVFEAVVPPAEGSGLHGYTVRVVPKHADLTSPFHTGLVTWAP